MATTDFLDKITIPFNEPLTAAEFARLARSASSALRCEFDYDQTEQIRLRQPPLRRSERNLAGMKGTVKYFPAHGVGLLPFESYRTGEGEFEARRVNGIRFNIPGSNVRVIPPNDGNFIEQLRGYVRAYKAR